MNDYSKIYLPPASITLEAIGLTRLDYWTLIEIYRHTVPQMLDRGIKIRRELLPYLKERLGEGAPTHKSIYNLVRKLEQLGYIVKVRQASYCASMSVEKLETNLKSTIKEKLKMIEDDLSRKLDPLRDEVEEMLTESEESRSKKILSSLVDKLGKEKVKELIEMA